MPDETISGVLRVRRLGSRAFRAIALLALSVLIGPRPAYADVASQVSAAAERAGFAGTILVSRGEEILLERAFGPVRPGAAEPHVVGARWRWGSITKQVLAILAMRAVEAGRLELDAPIARYWPDFPNDARDTITIRHLLKHRSGLPDPDDTARDERGLPAFYSDAWADRATAGGHCAGPSRTAPGGNFAYNNCDFIVLGEILERVTGRDLASLVRDLLGGGVVFYPAGEPTVPGFDHGEPEPPIRLAAYAGAGGLNGTARDLWLLDRMLLSGRLMNEPARAEMWASDPALGYAALGQWVFPAPLAGCAEPARLVERRGAIGGVQARNFLLPDADIVVIAFTNRSENEFDFGEIWRGEGFAHDLLAAAACP